MLIERTIQGLHKTSHLRRYLSNDRPIVRQVPSEVARLVQTLNRTFDKHRGLLEENRAFIAQATHQIKTPIAAILTRAELLEKEVEDRSRDSVKDLIVRARYASKLARISRPHDQVFDAVSGSIFNFLFQ